MDWMNRGQQRPSHPASQPAAHNTQSASAPAVQPQQGGIVNKFGDMKLATLTLLVSVAVLLLALIGYAVLGGGSSTSAGEGRNVKGDKMQAVFLNGGQVYFGKIRDLNGKYLHLSDIYYLRVNQQVQPNQSQQNTNDGISLVKLGCELHGPEDQMFINRDQVVFWENLKADGQVAQAVAEYVKQNPEGQKCETGGQAQPDPASNATPPTGSDAGADANNSAPAPSGPNQ